MATDEDIAKMYGLSVEGYANVKSSITKIMKEIQADKIISQPRVYELIESHAKDTKQAIMITSAVITLSGMIL